MTEAIKLSAPAQKFIVHWGEMGTRWGVNRTVAQIHALLFICEPPLNAQMIAKTLQVARSNVSASIHELLAWELIKVTHLLGDRKDYYEAVKDVYEMALIVLRGRKKREIDPTVEVLEVCVQDLEKVEGSNEEYVGKQMHEILSFIKNLNGIYEKLNKLPLKQFLQLSQLANKIEGK